MFDSVLRDRDGNGKFDADPCQSENEDLGELIYFGPNPYTLTVADDLKSVRVEPYSGPTGELTVKNGDKLRALTLARQSGGNKWESLTVDVSAGKANVPVGTYQLYSCVAAARDSNGVIGLAAAQRPTTVVAIKVESGKNASLECGPPLDVQVQAQKVGSAGGLLGASVSGAVKTLQINASIIGLAGERYAAFAKGKGTVGEAPPPTFRVLDATGKEVASGQLEYG